MSCQKLYSSSQRRKKKREKLEERGKGSRVRRTYSEKRMKKQPEW